MPRARVVGRGMNVRDLRRCGECFRSSFFLFTRLADSSGAVYNALLRLIVNVKREVGLSVWEVVIVVSLYIRPIL